VHAKDLLVNDRRNGEAVEAVGKGLPQLDAVAGWKKWQWQWQVAVGVDMMAIFARRVAVRSF
jgi:hypothetical protein